jgi:hypothetical protein
MGIGLEILVYRLMEFEGALGDYRHLHTSNYSAVRTSPLMFLLQTPSLNCASRN